MKFPKYRKGRIYGVRDGGNEIAFGKYALQVLEPARITSKQIEAGRRALQMNVRRGGKGGRCGCVCFRTNLLRRTGRGPYGKRKGAISYWAARLKRVR
ncbi:putative ribosomal protein L16 [Helianthus annuus]|nr:putative ribosomal protein L16 [Helianthus annuus]